MLVNEHAPAILDNGTLADKHRILGAAVVRYMNKLSPANLGSLATAYVDFLIVYDTVFPKTPMAVFRFLQSDFQLSDTLARKIQAAGATKMVEIIRELRQERILTATSASQFHVGSPIIRSLAAVLSHSTLSAPPIPQLPDQDVPDTTNVQ